MNTDNISLVSPSPICCHPSFLSVTVLLCHYLTSPVSLFVVITMCLYLSSGFTSAFGLHMKCLVIWSHAAWFCPHQPGLHLLVSVAPCRLPVCAHGEGWELGHHSDPDLGAKLSHPEAGWGGTEVHHTWEFPCTQERTPSRQTVRFSGIIGSVLGNFSFLQWSTCKCLDKENQFVCFSYNLYLRLCMKTLYRDPNMCLVQPQIKCNWDIMQSGKKSKIQWLENLVWPLFKWTHYKERIYCSNC